MNKTELIKAIATETGYTQKDTGAVIEAFASIVMETISSGEEVNIAGFGKFSVSERAEREGRNPATGETITIAASKSPKFKAATAFKSAVNA
jgi:DNA-binding protein HU-beta